MGNNLSVIHYFLSEEKKAVPEGIYFDLSEKHTISLYIM